MFKTLWQQYHVLFLYQYSIRLYHQMIKYVCSKGVIFIYNLHLAEPGLHSLKKLRLVSSYKISDLITLRSKKFLISFSNFFIKKFSFSSIAMQNLHLQLQNTLFLIFWLLVMKVTMTITITVMELMKYLRRDTFLIYIQQRQICNHLQMVFNCYLLVVQFPFTTNETELQSWSQYSGNFIQVKQEFISCMKLYL